MLSLPVPGGEVGRAFAPPLRFKPITGDIQYANRIDNGPFGNVRKLSGTVAQKNGVRYERRVQGELLKKFPNFIGGQWFEFRDKLQRRYCQVDGLTIEEDWTGIFEVKYSLVADAWWQLRHLYEPVVRKALLPKRLCLFVICRNFDPAIQFPENPQIGSPSSLGVDWRGDASLTIVPWRL